MTYDENKIVDKIIEDLKWYLDTNTEMGVVYIPKHSIEQNIERLKSLKAREEEATERIEYLKGEYVDTCNMCTGSCSCNDCVLSQVIDDLDEILQKVREKK